MAKRKAVAPKRPPYLLRPEETYDVVRAEAQEKANDTGFDYGIEQDPFFMSFRSFMLPRKTNRCGHELRCEVVMCERLDKCQPGHGPC
jgi:hypothetical protein